MLSLKVIVLIGFLTFQVNATPQLPSKPGSPAGFPPAPPFSGFQGQGQGVKPPKAPPNNQQNNPPPPFQGGPPPWTPPVQGGPPPWTPPVQGGPPPWTPPVQGGPPPWTPPVQNTNNIQPSPSQGHNNQNGNNNEGGRPSNAGKPEETRPDQNRNPLPRPQKLPQTKPDASVIPGSAPGNFQATQSRPSPPAPFDAPPPLLLGSSPPSQDYIPIVSMSQESNPLGYSFQYVSADGSERGEQGINYACGPDDLDGKCLSITGYYVYFTPDGQSVRVDYVSGPNGHQQTMTQWNGQETEEENR